MKSFRIFGALALACAIGSGTAAFGANTTVTLPQVTNVGPSDLFADVVGGSPTATTYFAKGGQISSVELYSWGGTITGDPAYTFTNGVTLYSAHKASGLSTATITTEPNPTDGKRECYLLDQTTTTLTWTANTGQTIDSSVRGSGVASVPTCIIYVASLAKWVQGN